VFNSIAINGDGKISTCCGNPKTITNLSFGDSLDHIINNPTIVNVRESLIAGEEHPICDFCWVPEQNGITSQRKYSKHIITNIQVSTKITYDNIQHISLFLGNKCNLACRMCFPTLSSLLANQSKKLYPFDEHLDKNIIPTEFTTDQKQKILEIIDISPNLNKIHVWGGEPLVIDFFDEMCEHLIATGKSSNIELLISTNLQSNIERKLEYFKHFKKITLSISMDGLDDTYEYIRWPGKFNKIKDNIKSLAGHPTIHPDITCVVQNLNVHNLTDFIIEMKLLNFSINFVEVHTYNLVSILPYHVIEREIEKLQNLKTSQNMFDAMNIDNVINILTSNLEKSKSIEHNEVVQFFKKQKDFDSIYNQNLFNTRPHFLELAKQFNVDIW
jgi:MoaA/NifB/PqqE/SkfB family radical SAM enzyme